jgi:hypothetical protein
MGGSSGIFRGGRSPQGVADDLRKIAEKNAEQFETELADEFGKLLSKFNARNSEETNERLTEIKEVLRDGLETTFDIFFGGSVAKHTYVDGISDVDSLLVVSGDLADANPQPVLNKVTQTLQERLGAGVEVWAGSVAVTVKYPDATEIQLVPCVKEGEKIKVPAWEANTWSSINPQQFRDGLTKRNNECAGKLIPTLKLAKAVNATLPDGVRLSGYHIESLGVAAFRGYSEERSTVRMLPYFFKQASQLVLKPMADRTGQSVHVDQHLGEANSAARVAASHTLARIHQRMANASAAKSRGLWLDLFGE